MKLNSKLTGGLAWAGLIVVLAVPSADLLTGRMGEGADTAATPANPESIRTAVVSPAPVQVKPVAAPAVAGGDAVDTLVQSGKKVPSYISDAPAAVAPAKPVTAPRLSVPGVPSTTTKPPALAPAIEVASLPTVQSDLVAPVPYPASKRPRAPLTASPSTLKPVASPTVAAPTVKVPAATPSAPAVATTNSNPPLVIDENLVQQREAAVARVLEEDQPVRRPNRIEADQLEEWDSGSLAEYLERRGLMSGQAQAANDSFDEEDGFFIEDRRSDARVVRRLPRNDFF